MHRLDPVQVGAGLEGGDLRATRTSTPAISRSTKPASSELAEEALASGGAARSG